MVELTVLILFYLVALGICCRTKAQKTYTKKNTKKKVGVLKWLVTQTKNQCLFATLQQKRGVQICVNTTEYQIAKQGCITKGNTYLVLCLVFYIDSEMFLLYEKTI